MKRDTTFPKLQHYWSLTIRLFSVISGHSLGESYPSAEMQSVYLQPQPNGPRSLWIMFEMILNLINKLALKTWILQLSMKCLPKKS